MSTIQVLAGFSLTNRCILYASAVLSVPQAIAGLESHIPINIGFLAYNWYNQIQWYRAIKADQLHALCLLLPHLNLTFSITYLGGTTAANFPTAALLVVGTSGVIALNTVAACISWETNQREGFGVYQFFYFGWRTLDPHWHKFFLLWQIWDSIWVLSILTLEVVVIIAMGMGMWERFYVPPAWYEKYIAIAGEVASSLFWIGPLILWIELIVARNHIESATDWIAVWLFVAQVGALLIPLEPVLLKCSRTLGLL